MKIRSLLAAGTLLGAASMTLAADVDPAVNSLALVGINRTTGDMKRFDFSDGSLKSIGKVKTKSGTILTDIDASAYIKGNMNIWTFWTDPDDGLIKLMYVNALTAEATQVGTDLGTGHAGGAVAAQMTMPNGQKRWVNFVALQAKHVDSSNLKVTGALNINPNNSAQNEFTVDKPLATTMLGSLAKFTRDELHQTTPVNVGGVYYDGPASRVLVKPKGNGNQNSLKINDVVYTVNNNTTYVFTGDLNIRVWNSHIQNGKAMGQWWISIDANTGAGVTIDGVVETSVTDVHRIVRVDQRTGLIEHSVTLSRMYDGLATLDGDTFYASTGNKLYSINVPGETETLIGSMSKNEVKGLEFAGTTLMAFDKQTNTLQPVNTSNGQNIGSA
ncbi:MAG: hypothetical protein WD768_04450 [Phycisphaeraceae bacterium]